MNISNILLDIPGIEDYLMTVRLITGRDIGNELSFLAPIQGGRGVSLPVSSGLISRAPLYRVFYFLLRSLSW
jgi:hypothetical protein